MCDTDIFGLPPVLSELLKRQYGDEVTEKNRERMPAKENGEP